MIRYTNSIYKYLFHHLRAIISGPVSISQVFKLAPTTATIARRPAYFIIADLITKYLHTRDKLTSYGGGLTLYEKEEKSNERREEDCLTGRSS